MIKYNTYKTSGTEWIGDIPEHWKVKRLKDFASVENGKDYKHVEIDEGGYPVYGSGGEFRRSSEYIYDQPSVLLGRKGTIDKPLLVTEPFWTVDTMFYTIIKPNTDYRFFFYLCKTILFDMYTYGSALPSMTQRDLHTINFCRPKLIEQTAIANYLDDKTGKLDQLIKNKKDQIKRLKEIRQIEINTVVTKGLDPNVKLKPSGIEWIGDIPEHWGVKRIKDRVDLNVSSLGKDTDLELDIKYLDISNVNSTGLTGEIQKLKFFEAPSRARRIVQKGDVVMSTVRPYLKAITYLENIPENLIASTGFAVMTSKSNYNSKFLFYQTVSDWFNETVNSKSVGASYPALNSDVLVASKILVPPKMEQADIVNYLDLKTGTIDKLISNIENQIKQLQEIRKIEIYNAVTGKIKVG